MVKDCVMQRQTRRIVTRLQGNYPLGNDIVNVLPFPGSLLTLTVPSNEWAKCLTIARPRPVPPSSRDRSIHSVEALEHAVLIVRLDADAGVVNADLSQAAIGLPVERHAPSLGSVLHGIVQQIVEDLSKAFSVGPDAIACSVFARIGLDREFDTFCRGRMPLRIHTLVDDLRDVEGNDLKRLVI